MSAYARTALLSARTPWERQQRTVLVDKNRPNSRPTKKNPRRQGSTQPPVNTPQRTKSVSSRVRHDANGMAATGGGAISTTHHQQKKGRTIAPATSHQQTVTVNKENRRSSHGIQQQQAVQPSRQSLQQPVQQRQQHPAVSLARSQGAQQQQMPLMRQQQQPLPPQVHHQEQYGLPCSRQYVQQQLVQQQSQPPMQVYRQEPQCIELSQMTKESWQSDPTEPTEQESYEQSQSQSQSCDSFHQLNYEGYHHLSQLSQPSGSAGSSSGEDGHRPSFSSTNHHDPSQQQQRRMSSSMGGVSALLAHPRQQYEDASFDPSVARLLNSNAGNHNNCRAPPHQQHMQPAQYLMPQQQDGDHAMMAPPMNRTPRRSGALKHGAPVMRLGLRNGEEDDSDGGPKAVTPKQQQQRSSGSLSMSSGMTRTQVSTSPKRPSQDSDFCKPSRVKKPLDSVLQTLIAEHVELLKEQQAATREEQEKLEIKRQELDDKMKQHEAATQEAQEKLDAKQQELEATALEEQEKLAVKRQELDDKIKAAEGTIDTKATAAVAKIKEAEEVCMELEAATRGHQEETKKAHERTKELEAKTRGHAEEAKKACEETKSWVERVVETVHSVMPSMPSFLVGGKKRGAESQAPTESTGIVSAGPKKKKARVQATREAQSIRSIDQSTSKKSIASKAASKKSKTHEGKAAVPAKETTQTSLVKKPHLGKATVAVKQTTQTSIVKKTQNGKVKVAVKKTTPASIVKKTQNGKVKVAVNKTTPASIVKKTQNGKVKVAVNKTTPASLVKAQKEKTVAAAKETTPTSLVKAQKGTSKVAVELNSRKRKATVSPEEEPDSNAANNPAQRRSKRLEDCTPVNYKWEKLQEKVEANGKHITPPDTKKPRRSGPPGVASKKTARKDPTSSPQRTPITLRIRGFPHSPYIVVPTKAVQQSFKTPSPTLLDYEKPSTSLAADDSAQRTVRPAVEATVRCLDVEPTALSRKFLARTKTKRGRRGKKYGRKPSPEAAAFAIDSEFSFMP